MRKLITLFAAVLVGGVMLSSCGLFRGGKGEKCPAYTQVNGDQDIELAVSSEK